ncbi:MAG: hypothetical protein CBB69_011520 [Phycisphaera sp. TMED9]|nr:MAG: hypothetical protein CBB69_011520 [Phycisphaera sp. TMED9]
MTMHTNQSVFGTVTSSMPRHRARRGNTLVLVTAILVLLVIIATAYITRAQGGRVIAAAQRKAIDREDRAQLAVGVVANEIASNLFPKLVDQGNDPSVFDGGVATSSTPRLSRPFWLGQKLDRYMVDPQLDGDGNPIAAYNFAPYETKAWTNWPDTQGNASPFGPGAPNGTLYDARDLVIGDDNPVGNPGFADTRWLRSTEPQRAYDQNGNLGYDNVVGSSGFTHFSHLSWPATAENGWRVCFDIANIAAFDPTLSDPTAPLATPESGFTITATSSDLYRQGFTEYGLFQEPVALQTPYEQWLPGVVPARYNGTGDFLARRADWFGTPNTHFNAVLGNGNGPLPNFIKMNDLGPKREEFVFGTDRNVVGRTLADADGDGFTDSFWFLLPGASEDGLRQVAAVSIVDNAAMVDMNVATRFDRWSTAGQTPADIALTSRLVQPGAQATQFGDNANVYDTTDTWVGLFSDPQNTWPATAWNFNYAYDTSYQYRIGSFDGTETLSTQYNPLLFGDSTSEASSWLRQTGVLNQDVGSTGYFALEQPYRSLMVAFGDGDPDRARFDRRRYFKRRQTDGGLFVRRTDDIGQSLPVDQWTVRNVPPRGFTDADELELRMFTGSNYGPVVSAFERTVNRPWQRERNPFRSTLARSESVENFLDYYDSNPNGAWPPTAGIPIGDQLSADQLLRDLRHRVTTYGSVRNDLRPLHLRPTALFDPDYDYAFGRLRSTAPEDLLTTTNQTAFDVRKQKLDLRGSALDAPITEFESLLYSGEFADPFNVVGAIDPDDLYAGVWPPILGGPFAFRVELDRSFRFRQELQETFGTALSGLFRDPVDGTNYTQSYLGNSYANITENQNAYLKTQLMAASWAANIDTNRDNRLRGTNAFNYADSNGPASVEGLEILDQPIYPDWAPRVSQEIDGYLGAIDQDLKNLTFPGMERQPFIMESFFALVYPKSRISSTTANELDNDEDYQQYLLSEGIDGASAGDDTIPTGFIDAGDSWVDKESEPAIVFAIQLANPYEEPVGLHDVYIRVGDNIRPLNLGRLPSPHPQGVADRTQPYYRPGELFLGPTRPDAPRTAIVFGIIPPGFNTNDGTADGDFEYEFGVKFEEFHAKWMDFLDLEPGNLFGWDANLPLDSHQTMVFDASPRSFRRATPASTSVSIQPVLPPLLSSDPQNWFDDPDRSVEVLKFVQNPTTFVPGPGSINNNGYLYVIDRLDNEHTGAEIEFKDQMKRLVEDDFAPTMDQDYIFDLNSNDRREWNGIRLEGDDFFVSWVRAGRPWGWDVNRNGVYDMTEVNPRYVFAEIPEDDWVKTEVDAVVLSSGSAQVKGNTIDLDDDPDTGGAAGAPWLTRSYLLPLATRASGGAGGFAFDFDSVRGKPVNFTTATALVGGAGTPTIDFDAGFPVFADGSIRLSTDSSGWPGQPASNFRWVMMDKGQSPDETLPGTRSGIASGSDGNGNGVDDGLEQYQRVWLEKDQWAYPLQMLQKDADYEQVGEITNAFLWGHAVRHRPGVTSPQSFNGLPLLETIFTFGEIMNGVGDEDLLPVAPREYLDDVGIPNTSGAFTNRFRPTPGNLTAPVGASVDAFRPFTQVVEVSAVGAPWTPKLPAGLSVFDALVCDGPGANYRMDLDGDGALDAVELLAIEDARYGNAAGFQGAGTRGLINVNTASTEVMRTLPHMSRLVYNDTYDGWDGLGSSPSDGNAIWRAYAPAAQLSGDVTNLAVPKPIATRNPQWVRVPEAIDRYRDGGAIFSNGNIKAVQVAQNTAMPFTGNVAMPSYDDRGTYGYGDAPEMAAWLSDNVVYPDLGINGVVGLYPGMRRGQGIASLGELMLLDRVGVSNGAGQSWPQRSTSITGAGLDPYAYQYDFGAGTNYGSSIAPWDPAALDPAFNTRLGLGWRPEVGNTGAASELALQADARLSTDRRNISWFQSKADASTRVEIPDEVASDAEEANLLFAGISNLVSVRSDVFTVHMRIRSFRQNPVSGLWNATDPEFIVDDSRYVFVVDRTKCDLPGETPEIRLLSKVPN